MKLLWITALFLLFALSTDAFAPSMMCTPSKDNAESRAEVSKRPSGLSRRESLKSFLKGGAAVVLGETVLSEAAEVGALRAAPIVAEEVAEAGTVAAGAEGAAILRNGQQVLQSMEKTIFGI
mmetsp:Transcript_16675/g.34177  ORF Transcript_16675/g.34177 Transcript_16675/m.34177 type:complete len:122 (+) Transcript_16675:98-463(+)